MSLSNAYMLGESPVARWLIENSPINIAFYQAWAWQGVDGQSLTYPRATELSPAAVRNDCGEVIEQLPTVSQAAFNLYDFIAHYSICSIDLDRVQYPTQLDAAMFAIAKRQILYAYAEHIVSPTIGLPAACDSDRNVDMGLSSLTLDCLDDAYSRVTAGTGRPTLIMSSTKGLRTYRSLCRAAGIPQERSPWTWYYPAKGSSGPGSVDSFNGTPWLVNDFINKDGHDGEYIFFMVTGDDGGQGPTRGVTGITPRQQVGRMFNKRTVQGIFAPDGGGGQPAMLPGVDVWVSTPAGYAVGSQGALSIIRNFTPVSDCSVG
ncbi:MAG: hypothetical protein KDB68_08800 [Planctomycetes bacterium]|nr:hypothetical protein [Planctomycetota bacterium]MCA8936294.1 hypothetical protein [Planctomycetota bacterium]